MITRSLSLTLFLVALVSVPSIAQDSTADQSSALSCGKAVQGISICLSQSSDRTLLVEIRNIGPTDSALNLGVMLANGKRQFPTAVQLVLIDSGGTEYRPIMDEPTMVAGRIDPFVVPLPAGASMRVPLHLSKLDTAVNHTKTYSAYAEFRGAAVGQAQTNLDSRGIALMPYWVGTVSSGRIALRMPIE
jgi:hypothetical protein